jgi:aldehyde oxidoreductase
MNGWATKECADRLFEAMRKPDGSYRTHAEMVAEGIPTKYEHQVLNSTTGVTDLDPNTGIGNPTPEFTYALFMAEVEVDAKTGKTTVLKYTCVDDVGVIGNIAAVNGQAYGGMSHTIGFALSENYDDVKKHSNILGAGIPAIKDIPDELNVIHLCTPREIHPFGSSGASEAYQSSGHMAVINAIHNATGVRIYELPASPGKVKAGMETLAKGGRIEPPQKYFLGSDFIDEMNNILNNPM